MPRDFVFEKLELPYGQPTGELVLVEYLEGSEPSCPGGLLQEVSPTGHTLEAWRCLRLAGPDDAKLLRLEGEER